MLARELISEEIPPLKISDTGLKALQWMEEFKVTHLPIVKGREFLGLVSDDDILDLNTPEEPLSSHRLSLIRPYVYDLSHIYEVIKLVNNLNLTLVPVLDEQNNYEGVIPMAKLVQSFAGMASLQDPGGVIILMLNVNDYSLTEIANIVEGNDARILSMYITSHSDSTQMEVTLKINRTDLTGILQTFYRYQYNVKASFHQSEFSDDFRQRYDSFMNYLNM